MTTAPAGQLAPDTRTAGVEQVEPRRADADNEQRLLCAVCAHEVEHHDPIGARYCRATQAQALPRGCICTRVD